MFLFADDSVLIKPIFLDSDFDHIQSDVDLVVDWCRDNSLRLNESKCKVMIFSYSKLPVSATNLYCNGKLLDRVFSYKYLGVILQSNLTWDFHCKNVLKRGKAIFYSFKGFYHRNTSRSILLLIFCRVIRPILEYCAEIVFPNQFYSRQFESFQRFVCCCHLNIFDRDLATSIIIARCGLNRLSTRRCVITVVSLYKYLLQSHYFHTQYFCWGFETGLRHSERCDTKNDLFIVRCYPTDRVPKPITSFSASFKSSFLFRSVKNYNIIRRGLVFDEFTFSNLKTIFSYCTFSPGGIFV